MRQSENLQQNSGVDSSLHRRERRRFTLVFVLLAAALAAAFIASLCIGSVTVTPGQIASVLSGEDRSSTAYDIIMQIRLPRILAALILGGALSLAGFLLQTFFANPIAGPFVLGISSGAKMLVALVTVVWLGHFASISSGMLIVTAFLGSLVATLFILAVSRKVSSMAALLVAGIMIGYICSAVTDFIVTFADDADIANLHDWSQGSFSGISSGGVVVCAAVVGIASVMTFLMAKPIGAFLLGENYAASMGVNVPLFRVIIILLSSVLSACVTAFAGPISFVGIAVPYLVRRVLHTSKPIVVIPASFLGGALFCLVCDLIARMAFAPMELNISTVTAIFGAPVVIVMLVRRRR